MRKTLAVLALIALATTPAAALSNELGRAVNKLARERFPTPDVVAAKGRGQKSADARSRLGGSLNPVWVEWLMGWPLNWSSAEPLSECQIGSIDSWRSAMARCLSALRSRGRF